MEFWLAQMSQELTAAQSELTQMRIGQRVHLGVKTRLELEVPYKAVWPQGMALGAQPQNIPTTMR